MNEKKFETKLMEFYPEDKSFYQIYDFIVSEIKQAENKIVGGFYNRIIQIESDCCPTKEPLLYDCDKLGSCLRCAIEQARKEFMIGVPKCQKID